MPSLPCVSVGSLFAGEGSRGSVQNGIRPERIFDTE